MKSSRWMRVCAIVCVLCMFAAAAAAQETADETERIIDPGILPENIQKLLETAIGELGYTERSDGYSKYGAWTGDPYSEWCAEFVCWCVHMTDQLNGYDMLNNVYPYYTGQNTGRDWFVTRGRFVFRRGFSPGWGWQWLKNGTGIMQTNDYIPYPGDLMYLSGNSAGDTVHVAIVEYCAYAADGSVRIHVIEGNNPSSVQRAVYNLSEENVLGFGCWGDVVDTTIQYANSGDKVLDLQKNLGKIGYLNERHFTSTFLSNTRNAVSRFQQTVMDITPTGVADRQTQLAIQYEVDKMELYEPSAWLVTEGN